MTEPGGEMDAQERDNAADRTGAPRSGPGREDRGQAPARLLHLSDLHFGKVLPELVEPLIAAAHALAPEIVVISGDLTQRARDHQFAEARAFVDRLPAPVLCVPGNHDVPLDRPLSRWLRPWRGWRGHLGAELEPEWRGPGFHVVGVNTVDRSEWQRGKIRAGQLARVRAAFETASEPVAGAVRPPLRVVAAHHPFEALPDDGKSLMRGAADGARALAGACDLVLTGHLHRWHVGPLAAGPDGPERATRPGAIQAHAGTGLSSRLRGQENDFNLVEVAGDRVTLTRHLAPDGALAFEPAEVRRFLRGPKGLTSAD